MKKLIILFVTLSCLLSCNEPPPKGRYLVEDKRAHAGAYRMIISDLNTKQGLRVITVGKYTYDNTQLGDTLIINYE